MSRTSAEQLTLVANTVRGLAMDAVQKANSGHPGMPMGMADVAAALWLDHLRYSPDDPQWRGRDRFVLSAGHGSMLLYAMLHLAGYEVELDDLKNFRQLNSCTPGHPEFGDTPGVETTTGPLGQGFGNGVGMALGARMEAARFGCPLFETRVFGIVSDGDIMEGVCNEAASVAGHLGLSNLVYLYDDNRITIDGDTNLSFSEDVQKRFEALGWRVLSADGHDYNAVQDALDAAIAETTKPSMIICRTHIGYGSPKVDSAASHGAPIGEKGIAATKEKLGMPAEDFHVPQAVRELFAARALHNHGERKQWLDDLQEWRDQNPDQATQHRVFAERRTPEDLLKHLVEKAGNDANATRGISGKVIQKAGELVPSLCGGSADLNASCKSDITASQTVSRGDYAGRNFCFGIREHGMGAILNGLALHGGHLPLGSTFLIFSDYMRPSIRLAALMKLPVTYVYTHDSLMVGEDGPTHQPVEQLASLRLIPNLHVFRPADGPEVAAAWTHALTRGDGPVALALTRQKVPPVTRSADFDAADALRGGYTIADRPAPKAVLVATGAEVHVAVAAAEMLAEKGKPMRVVSMPCLELFLAQDAVYRSSVLPDGAPVLALEMGRPEIWCQLTGSVSRVVGVQTFGKSAPAGDLQADYGFTAEQVAGKLETILDDLA